MGKAGKQQITASSLWLPGAVRNEHYSFESHQLLRLGQLRVYKDLEPVPFSLPVDWDMDPYELKSWRMYFQSLNWIHGYRLAYDKGAAEGLDTMVNILNDWWLKNRDIEEPSAMVWDDHATSDRLANICSIVTLLERPYDHIPNLDAMVSKHVQTLCGFYESKKWIRNNHAVFHVGALLDAHLMGFTEKTGVDCLQVATDYLREFISSVINEDSGFSVEQSMFYHQFLVRILRPLLRLARETGVIEIEHVKSAIDRVEDFAKLVSTSDGTTFAIGDTSFGFRFPKVMVDQVVDNGLYCFPESGLSVFRDCQIDGEHLALFSCPPRKAGHGHYDPLNFMLVRDGKKLLIDSGGPYAYGDKLRYEYFRAADAHNVPRIDGVTGWQQSTIQASDEGHFPWVIATSEQGSVTITRAVISLGQGDYLVADSLESPTPFSATIPWHIAPDRRLTHVEELEHGFGMKCQLVHEDGQCPTVMFASSHSSEAEFSIHPSRDDPTTSSWTTSGIRDKRPTPLILQRIENTRFHASVMSIGCDVSVPNQLQFEDGILTFTHCGRTFEIDASAFRLTMT